MQSLLDVQKAFYAPNRGPPMLLYHEPNPLRRRKRKRRKLAKNHVPIPHRPKDILPSNFPASQLPEGFPPELAFRALAAYSLLRTLSRELRLSPFTPNVFLRALYLPFPSKLIGQVHASLLRILLASLNMGYSCKPKGSNIPDVIRKKRRIDGIRWPLRAGDNLTFLDNFSWPLFYDDYAHLTADILWATMNDEENHADFRSIGMPDLTGMILEEDLREQEEEKALMAKAVSIANRLPMHEKNPYALDNLTRSSRSSRRAKTQYANVESDEDSYEEEPLEEEPDIEEDEDYMDRRKGKSMKRGRSNARSLPKSSTAKLPAQNQSMATPSPYSIHARGTNGSNQRQKQRKQAKTPSSAMAKGKGKVALATPGSSKTKKNNRMLPSSRAKKKGLPVQQEGNKKRSPGAGRKLPTQKGSSPPAKKTKRSPFSGSKVEWVEEGPSPSHFGGKSSSAAISSGALPTPRVDSTPNMANATASTAAVPNDGQEGGVPRHTVVPPVSVSPFVGQHVANQNAHMGHQYNAALLARARFAQQAQSTAAAFYPSGPSVGYNSVATPIHNQSLHPQNSGYSGLRLPSSAKPNSRSGHTVSKEVSSALQDFIGGKLFEALKQSTAPTSLKGSTSEVTDIKAEPDKPASVPSTSTKFKHQKETLGHNIAGASTSANSTVNHIVKADQSDGILEVKLELPNAGVGVVKGDQTETTVAGNASPVKLELGESSEAFLEAMDVDQPSSLTDKSTMVSTSTGNEMENGNSIALAMPNSASGGDVVSNNTPDQQQNSNGCANSSGAPVSLTATASVGNAIIGTGNIQTPEGADASKVDDTPNGHHVNDLLSNKAEEEARLKADTNTQAASLMSRETANQATTTAGCVPCGTVASVSRGATEANQYDGAPNSAVEVLTATDTQTKRPNQLGSVSAAGTAVVVVGNEASPAPQTPATLIEPMNAATPIQPKTTPSTFTSEVHPAPHNIAPAEKQGALAKGSRFRTPAVQSVVSKKEESVIDLIADDADDQSENSQESDASLPFAEDEAQWPQFQPIKSMRAGMPYHRLPLEEKLTMLEFLIDELLSMGTFASVFSQRDLTNMDGSTFAALPSNVEFDELENEDECAVCKGEGELLCCDGCVSSYHRSCIDMKQNEVLPEGRWLCPECELVDPAKYGSLRGGRKSSLDWFTIDDIHTAIRLKNAGEQNTHIDGMTATRSTWAQHPQGASSSIPMNSARGSAILDLSSASDGPLQHSVVRSQSAIPLLVGLNGNTPGQPGMVTSHNVGTPIGVLGASAALTNGSAQQLSTVNPFGATVVQNATMNVPGGNLGVGQTRRQAISTQGSAAFAKEYLVVHGFVFARPRGGAQSRSQSNGKKDIASSFEPLSKTQLCQVLKSIGLDTCLAWPLAQIPFTTLDESGIPVSRGVGPKVLTFDTKATYDPSSYNSKYRRTPLAKSAFPGANFQAIQLLLSDYEYACNTCNLKRLSDRLSPDFSTDGILAKVLQAEANLFDPYQLVRDYLLKIENLLNRAHLLSEFWGTKNKDIKAHVWQMNVRNCRSVPRLAQLLLMLVDACHRRAFTEHWFLVSGSKEADSPLEEAPRTDSRTQLNPLPPDWTLKAEKRKRKWERSSLANVLSLLAQEGEDVEKWVYGEGKVAIKRKRKQAVTGRSPYSPSRILVSSKDSKKFVVDDELTKNTAALAKRNIAALQPWDKDKRKPSEADAPGVVSVQVLQQAIDRRVTTGIPNDRERIDSPAATAQDEETGGGMSAISRRSRRSGRLQTKKESPEDFIANVIADTGKAQKDLSMATLIEAQKMAKLVEIKEVSAIPFGGTGHWPVAGRLLFDPVGSLCRSEMRRLGRNAGTVRAQDVKYTGSYEVGEVSHFHVWRKNMKNCVSYEQLLLLIRTLESSLDKPTITSCEALARRTPHARSQISKAIQCTQKDALTGLDHHFILPKNKSRGNWVSSLALELSPFMVERSDRREKQQEAFSLKLREKSMAEARAREAARLKAAAKAAARTQALMREQAAARARAQKEQAEAKAKAQQEKAEAKAAAKAAKAVQKERERAEKAAAKAKLKAERDAAKEASRQAIRANAMYAPSANSMPQQARNVVGMQNDVQRVLTAHKFATQQLIRESSNAGLSFVPEAKIKQLRMKAAADLQKCYRGVQINNDTLFAQLGKAETDALKAETEAKKATVDKRLQHMAGGTQPQSTSKQSSQSWSPANQTIPGSSQQAARNTQRPQAAAPMYPTQNALQNAALAKSGVSASHMQQVRAGQHGSLRNAMDQSTNPTQFCVRGNPSLSPSPMQVSRQKSQGGAPYSATPSNYATQTNAYTPNQSGFLQQQNPRSALPQSASSSRGRASTPSQQSATIGVEWSGASPQLLPNQLLQALGGDAGKQHSLQVANNQSRGNGNAWNFSRSAQESQAREGSRGRQMADLARLANGGANMQNLLHGRSSGGMRSHQQAPTNMRAPGSAGQYQDIVSGNDYRPGLPPSNSRLQNAMNNLPGGQFYQSPTPGGSRSGFPPGYNNPNMYGAPASGYRQDIIPGRNEVRMNAQPQQGFDFEPTPIAEMAPAPVQAPLPNNAYNPNGYPQQQRPHQQQQHPHQHQWFQR